MLLASSYQLNAQSRHHSHKRITGHRVSRDKVVYKTPKRKVLSYRALPGRSVVNYKGIKYYYKGNKYYAYSGGRYISIVPKIGFKINVLPIGYLKIHHNNIDYYWYDGVFYNRIGRGYEVIEPEIGTVVSELPHDHEKVQIDGLIYYEFNNVLYEKIQLKGTRAYEIVGFID